MLYFEYNIKDKFSCISCNNYIIHFKSTTYFKFIYNNKYYDINSIEFNYLIKDNYKAQKNYIDHNIINFNRIEFGNFNDRNDRDIIIFDKNKIHCFEQASFIVTGNDKKFINYFIYGNEYSYEDWLNHPEKVRYDRNKKLELL